MKKPDWKKLLKQAFSPKNEDARAQEKAAAWALGSILVLIFFPVMIIQFAVEGAKLAVMYPIMLVSIVVHEKLGIKNKTALSFIMGMMLIFSFVTVMALLGFLGRMYRGL